MPYILDPSYNGIGDVLTRFRRAPVALTADISQMFLQVGLAEKDRRFHRFLWRGLDETKQPEVYEFMRLPFGNTASPFCAQHVLHSHAETNKELYPEAADTVDNSMYVDDVLDSCETVPEAKDLRKQTTELLSEAGFPIAKLFDPMQILPPFTIRAKILLQKIWATGIEWDEQLPAKLDDEWNDWTKE